jgi:SAM-dependent methyltransferase
MAIDFAQGKGVDVVLTDPYVLPLGDETVDIVVSSSCFEHSEMFWLLFLEILRILKPAGLFYLNAPSNGAFHRYPVDCWRFYPDSGAALVNWAKRNKYDPLLLESFIGNQDMDVWNDFVAVFLKDKRHAANYPARILEIKTDFTNGRIAEQKAMLNPRVLPEDLERLKSM